MDYVDGELPEHVKACFDMHLQMCPPCVEYLKTYELTVVVTKDCFKEPANDNNSGDMPEQLVKAILAARKLQSPPIQAPPATT
jgi:hypothetical protein